MKKILWYSAISGVILLGLLVFYFQDQRIYATEAFQTKTVPNKKTRPQTTVTFIVAGDVMLSRRVAAAVKNSNDLFLPYRKLEPLLNSTDFNIANLESPFSGTDKFHQSGIMFNAPRYMIHGLVKYKFKVLNFANNHALDQGKHGLKYTQQYLTKHGITYVGTGQTLDDAWQGKVITIKSIRIGLIGASYTSFNDNGKKSNNFVARIEDREKLKSAILNLKSKSDYIIVIMHAGEQYVRNPNQSQRNFAHAAIDYNADLVIGSHSHWIQTIEKYKGKWIFYGLGNFIFDQKLGQSTKEGLILKIQLTKNGMNDTRLAQIQLMPVIIENYCCPRLANDTEIPIILNKIGVTTLIIEP